MAAIDVAAAERFATISLALFETAELLAVTIFARFRGTSSIKFSKMWLVMVACGGGAAAAIPLIAPSNWLAPIVWLSFIFFIDPINALRGWPSITGDLASGDWRRLLSLLTSGLVCGVLWEFWNYWALSKWTYTVPYFGNAKIFEMPVLGYLGFPPFAVQCWVIYIFLRSLLQRPERQTGSSEIFVHG